MSLFNRRNKIAAHSVSTRHNGPPAVSGAASSAATLAFLSSQKSNPSLSAAAAAAALKNNPAAPTNVGNAQTRRIQRRESNGSGSGSPRPGLERRTSLTDRNLRTPSPGRDGAAARSADAPPMPRLPQNITQLDKKASARNRASSLEGPQRISSPPPRQPGGRGVSLDRASQNPVSSRAVNKMPKVSEQPGTGPRSSVNYSRPMSPSARNSPTSAPQPTGWHAGSVASDAQPRQSVDSLRPRRSSALSDADVSGIQVGLQAVANQPVKKKKKVLQSHGKEGAHLAQGTMDIAGTAVQPFHRTSASSAASRGDELEPPTSPVYAESEGSRVSFDSDSETSSVTRSRAASSRTGGVLARQPSVVNEVPEPEEQSERAKPGRKVAAVSAKSQRDTAPVVSSPPATLTPQSAVTNTLLPTTTQQDSRQGTAIERAPSVSPARSAHFSESVEYLAGDKHLPAGRSTSPMKSAIKHSPSASIRTASPDLRQGPSPANGGAGHSRRKSSRVSFDENPIYLNGPESTKYTSQPFSHAKGPNDFDTNDVLQPTPTLPSFGSVRDRRDNHSGHDSRSELMSSEHSNDHAIGGILTQDHARSQSQRLHDPLAPEVTSVEGTGYGSDTSSEVSETTALPPAVKNRGLDRDPATIAEAVTAMQATRPENAHSGSHVPTASQNDAFAATTPIEFQGNASAPQVVGDVPMIALQPATPAAEEVNEQELVMPGAFPGAWNDEDDTTSPNKPFAAPAVPASTGIVAIHPAPARPHQNRLRTTNDSDSDSDDSAMWSDAEEDFSEGLGGFASLNAIVDTPTSSNKPGLAKSKHAPARIDVDMTSKDDAPPSPSTTEWDAATTYWKSLSQERKKQLEARAVKRGKTEVPTDDSSSGDDFEKDLEKVDYARPLTPERTTKQAKPQLESPIKLAAPVTKPGLKLKKEPKLRSSMRDSSVNEEPPRLKSSMKSSMRDQKPISQDGTHMRSSLRTAGTQPKNARRYSGGLDDSRWSQQDTAGKVTSTNRPMSAGGLPKPRTVPAPMPVLQRQDSDDSVSSFRRQRRAKRDGGFVSMRTSMRGGPAPEANTGRSASPPPTKSGRRNFSPESRTETKPAYNMPTSMRGSPGSDVGPRQQEIKKSRFKSPTRLGFGFGKSKNRRPESVLSTSSTAAAPTSAPRYNSRAMDDDSEDDEPTPVFKSRFADSDDSDDEVLSPVRGIPRTMDAADRDSTDLEDSDNEKERFKTKPPVPQSGDIDVAHGKAPTRLTNGDKAGQGSKLAAGSLRKHDGAGLEASKHAPTPARPEQKRRLSWLGLGSPRRSSSMPPADIAPSSPASRRSDGPKPKLQRRSTPTGLPFVPENSLTTDRTNWPLNEDRPTTSDGPRLAKSLRQRPDAAKRRSTFDDVNLASSASARRVSFNEGTVLSEEAEERKPGAVYSERTGKKKKFGALRKMFGLND